MVRKKMIIYASSLPNFIKQKKRPVKYTKEQIQDIIELFKLIKSIK